MEFKSKHLGKDLTKEKKEEVWQFSEGYKSFLKEGKTERECVTEIIRLAKEKGFKDASVLSSVKAGDRLYYVNRGKNVALFTVGSEPMSAGINMIVSHLDSPRLDIKPLPLIEESELALLKTHYYGGIKKYQWASIPLSLHGLVCVNNNGKNLTIRIGEAEDDPTFVLPDLLPHLDRKIQRGRKADEVIKGEEMQILIGSIPSASKDAKEPIKLAILEHLKENYEIIEEDFISAELEVVPALNPRDVGLDRSLIGAYGQDDRICVYTSLQAIFNLDSIPQRTSMIFFVDKEEIGSTGSTGMQSNYFVHILSDLMAKAGLSTDNQVLLSTLWSSSCLSADVSAGINPLFKEVHDLTNSPLLNHGIVITKYTGSGGKGMANDADAEFVGKIRRIFNKNKVGWQSGILGKVDEGGGGTVAQFISQWGVRTLDCGPALISMHSPFEISAKTDIWTSFQAYRSFLLECV